MTSETRLSGEFLHFDPECPALQDLLMTRRRSLTVAEAASHRLDCERCMMLAVLSYELLDAPIAS